MTDLEKSIPDREWPQKIAFEIEFFSKKWRISEIIAERIERVH